MNYLPLDIKKFEKATAMTTPLGNLDKAVSIFKELLKKSGPSKQLHLNIGNVYRLLDEDEKAFYHYKQACSDSVPFADGTLGPWDMGWTNLGLLTYDHGDDELACSYYRKAIEINSDSYNAIWNYGLSHLRRWSNGEGVDPALGWKMYNYRFVKPEATTINPKVRLWDGVSHVRTLAVLAEQGVGDRIHFGRYLKALESRCDQLIVECHPSMDVFFQDYHTVRDASQWLCDYGVPFCSIPAYFDHQPHDWLKDLVPENPGLLPPNSVIVEWTGNPLHANARHRNTVSTHFSDILTGPNVYSFHDRPHRNIKGLGQESWHKTCLYLKSSSLVITVDTALAHVSGSMGIPTIVIQPRKNTDFRWGRGGLGFDNIWYPNVKVIHNPGTWDKTFRLLKEYLVANHQQIGH